MAQLPEAERMRYHAIRATLRQRQFLWGRILLRNGLAEITGATDARLSYGPNGKPYLADWPQLHFSLSHAGAQLWAAAGPVPVGVDGEQVQPGRNVLALARRYFHPAEQTYLHATPPDTRLLRFYGLWSRKEALAKASGTGLTATLPLCVLSNTLAWREANWTFHALEAPEGYVAVLAYANPP